jgi:hypothetical protein
LLAQKLFLVLKLTTLQEKFTHIFSCCKKTPMHDCANPGYVLSKDKDTLKNIGFEASVSLQFFVDSADS